MSIPTNYKDVYGEWIEVGDYVVCYLPRYAGGDDCSLMYIGKVVGQNDKYIIEETWTPKEYSGYGGGIMMLDEQNIKKRKVRLLNAKLGSIYD